MARPIKFRIKKDIFKLESRCILCGKKILSNKIICDVCSNRSILRRRR